MFLEKQVDLFGIVFPFPFTFLPNILDICGNIHFPYWVLPLSNIQASPFSGYQLASPVTVQSRQSRRRNALLYCSHDIQVGTIECQNWISSCTLYTRLPGLSCLVLFIQDCLVCTQGNIYISPIFSILLILNFKNKVVC